MAVDPFSRNITVSTELNRRPFFAGVNGNVGRPRILDTLSPVFSFFFLPSLVLCIVECLTLCNAKMTNLFLTSVVWHLTLFCLLNPCNVVAQFVTSQLVTEDTTVTLFSHSDVLDPGRITRK